MWWNGIEHGPSALYSLRQSNCAPVVNSALYHLMCQAPAGKNSETARTSAHLPDTEYQHLRRLCIGNILFDVDRVASSCVALRAIEHCVDAYAKV